MARSTLTTKCNTVSLKLRSISYNHCLVRVQMPGKLPVEGHRSLQFEAKGYINVDSVIRFTASPRGY
jgi:hypothetical protein